MRRKLFSIILSLVMAVAMIPAMTAVSFAGGNYLYYKIDENGTVLHIRSYEEEGYTPFDSAEAAPWYKDSDKIEKVIIEEEIQPRSISYWFCSEDEGKSDSNIQSIEGFANLGMSRVEEADYAFAGLKDITTTGEGTGEGIGTGINLSNVRRAEGMFRYSSLNNTFLNNTIATATGSLTTADYMFSGCRNLTEFKFPAEFRAANCKGLLSASSITAVDVSDWEPSNSSNISRMFAGCPKLTTIKADKDADWSDITGCSGTDMFKGCSSLFGGEGTGYSADSTGLGSARIDKAESEGASAAGYFTDVNAKTITIKQPAFGGSITPAASVNFNDSEMALIPDGETLTIENSSTKRTLEINKKEGYDFIGWTLNREPLNSSQTVTGDAVLSAVIKKAGQPFAGGDGSEKDPYQIRNLEQMNTFADLIEAGDTDYNDKCYILTAKIGDNETCFERGIGAFYGTFDGDGYRILCRTTSDLEGFALFDENRGTIKNLKVEGSFEAANAAGICNKNYGRIEACLNSATIKATGISAGICNDNYGTIVCCKNKGNLVNSEGSDCQRYGICVNNKTGGTIRSCINVPGVAPISEGDPENYFAVCGKNRGAILCCYWDSEVQQNVEGICESFESAEEDEVKGMSTEVFRDGEPLTNLNLALEEGETSWYGDLPYPTPYTLMPIPMDWVQIYLGATQCEYTGRPITPEVLIIYRGKPVEEEYIKIEYVNNISIGTATVKVSGTDRYYGEKSVSFEIFSPKEPKDISDKTLVLDTTEFIYNGDEQKPTTASIEGLEEGIDFTTQWPEESINTGTYTVTATGDGILYTGSVSATYKITEPAHVHTPELVCGKKATFTADGNIEHWICTGCEKLFADEAATTEISEAECVVPKATASISKTTFTFNGKTQKPTVTVKDSKGNVINSVAVTNAGRKLVGKGTVKVVLSGDYSGTRTFTYTINPKKAVVSKTTPGKKKLTVKMKTKVAATGGATYQIAYKQKGTSKWKYTTTTKQSKVIKKLKKGKRYYVKVRAYKTVNNVKYYGAWSKTKLSYKIK